MSSSFYSDRILPEEKPLRMPLISAIMILFILTASGICTTDGSRGSLRVKNGSVFSIAIPSNPTTGYSWKIAKISNPLIIKNISANYIPDKADPGICGSGGREVWKFKALKCGNASIEFSYQRPWEKNAPPVEKKRYLIKVRP